MLALMIPAAFFGYFWAIATGFIAVLFHEGCHIVAARMFGIQTERIDLSPFGGLSAMDIAPSPKVAFFIALVGPLCNLIMVQLLLMLYRIVQAPIVQMFIVAHLSIGLFNLLPAYPLDGGRMLHILLTPLLGFERAKRLCCHIGILLAFGILGVAVYNAFVIRVVNLSFLLIGAMLLFMARRQLTTDVYTAMKHSQQKRKRLHFRPIETRQIVANDQTVAMELLNKLQKGQYLTTYIVDDGMKVRGILDETEILDGIVRFGSTATLKKILDHQQSSRVN